MVIIGSGTSWLIMVNHGQIWSINIIDWHDLAGYGAKPVGRQFPCGKSLYGLDLMWPKHGLLLSDGSRKVCQG